MKANLILCLALCLFAGYAAQAAPPIWETSYGYRVPAADPLNPTSLPGLEQEDDAVSEVTLGFAFPFEGIGYQRVFVGTNGCVQLGSLGADRYVDYDMWSYFEEFYDDSDGTGSPDPILCPFNSDLDNTKHGTVWFNESADRAVITWDRVGTNFKENSHLTFQIQLFIDGTILFGYNGVLDAEGESVDASSQGGSLDEGIVVGITRSDGTYPTPRIDFDLNGPTFAGTDTIFERWCYDARDSCGENGKRLGYTGGPNALWDLEGQNVIFHPLEGGGFEVKAKGLVMPPRRRPISR